MMMLLLPYSIHTKTNYMFDKSAYDYKISLLPEEVLQSQLM